MDAKKRAEAIREERRFTLEVETGDRTLEFECVAPTVMDLIDAGLDPILADTTATDDQRKAALEAQSDTIGKDIRKFYPIALKILGAAMVSPKLYQGDGVCPEDAVTPKDLGNLVFTMANTIFEILQKEVGEVGKTTARFRMDSNRTDGAGSGSDVRDEPAGHPEPTAP